MTIWMKKWKQYKFIGLLQIFILQKIFFCNVLGSQLYFYQINSEHKKVKWQYFAYRRGGEQSQKQGDVKQNAAFLAAPLKASDLQEAPRRLSGEAAACARRRCRFNPQVGKIPWRRTLELTLVFLPGTSHGQRSLAGYSPWLGWQRVWYDWAYTPQLVVELPFHASALV